ncbi:MAG: phenylalanine aminomutase (D-beta-phenylalanine forming) [Gammaproteobacteria bacterium]|nr:MAG: phenylalanine aminomutase (D-beta-phenylalanine forming) [Gammaproteobacteria bacterium]
MHLDGETLTVDQMVEAAYQQTRVDIFPEQAERVKASRDMLEGFVKSGRIIYGVTTAVGGFVNWLIPEEYAEKLQNNILRGVASNVGPNLDDVYVRAAMLCRINSLGRGVSAISPENFEKYIAVYNAGIVPCIPEQGSLGASGDLGPLAYIAMVVTGAWRAKYEGEIIPGAEALKRAGLEPARLSYKEGLAMINGTSVMVGVGAPVIYHAKKLLKQSALIAALTLEALRGKIMPYHPAVHRNKPHPGQVKVADAVWTTLADSKMVVQDEEVDRWLAKMRTDEPQGMDEQIEDAYSLRAAAQILGPSVDALWQADRTLQIEINSTNDNPLIIVEEGDAFHNAHFHGQYVSQAMDHVAIALTTACNLHDRRIDRYLDPHHNNGLPPFLCKENPGLRHGLMGSQYCAASTMAEMRSLCHPVSIQTLTTTGDFQDHVSMGLVAARRARDILNICYAVPAVELVCACQAVDQREGGAARLSTVTRKIYDMVRESVPYLDHDEALTDYIEAAAGLLRDGRLLDALPDGDLNWEL